MAIAKVRDLAGGNSKSSSTTIVTGVMPATVPIGDTVLVSYCGSTTTSAVSSVTDTKGNTYTVLADVAGTTSRMAIAGSVLTAALTTSDTITVTLAVASGIRCVAATEFSGLTITEDVTEKAAAGTSSTPSTGASGTTVTNNTLTYAAFGVSNGTASGTLTQGSGFTLDQAATTGTTGTNRSLGTEHRINSSVGTQTANGTYGTSMAWDALEVMLQEVASGTTYTKTGGATSGLAASAADADTFTETAGATSPFAASGADATTHAETAGATSGFVASGADASTHVETGGATSALGASGVSEHTSGGVVYVKAGGATTGLSASGIAEMAGGLLPPVYGGGGGGGGMLRIDAGIPRPTKRMRRLADEAERKRKRLLELAYLAEREPFTRAREREIARIERRLAVIASELERLEALAPAPAAIAAPPEAPPAPPPPPPPAPALAPAVPPPPAPTLGEHKPVPKLVFPVEWATDSEEEELELLALL